VPFDTRGAADTLDVPVLIVHSEAALSPDLARAFYGAVESPKQELWLQSQGQIDFSARLSHQGLQRSATSRSRCTRGTTRCQGELASNAPYHLVALCHLTGGGGPPP
jgi:hypothetical protein